MHCTIIIRRYADNQVITIREKRNFTRGISILNLRSVKGFHDVLIHPMSKPRYGYSKHQRELLGKITKSNLKFVPQLIGKVSEISQISSLLKVLNFIYQTPHRLKKRIFAIVSRNKKGQSLEVMRKLLNLQ